MPERVHTMRRSSPHPDDAGGGSPGVSSSASAAFIVDESKTKKQPLSSILLTRPTNHLAKLHLFSPCTWPLLLLLHCLALLLIVPTLVRLSRNVVCVSDLFHPVSRARFLRARNIAQHILLLPLLCAVLRMPGIDLHVDELCFRSKLQPYEPTRLVEIWLFSSLVLEREVVGSELESPMLLLSLHSICAFESFLFGFLKPCARMPLGDQSCAASMSGDDIVTLEASSAEKEEKLEDGDEMRLVESSLELSCGSDDFVAYLEGVIESGSSDSFAKTKADDNDETECDGQKRLKKCKVDVLEKSQALKSFSTFERPKHNSDASVEGTCTHPGSFQAMCVICAGFLPKNSGVNFGYICKGLAFADHEINRVRIRDLKNVQSQKKLYLILDLDHTLLNSTPLEFTTQEQYLRAQADSSQDGSIDGLFVLPHIHMVTKLRPFVRSFLKEASIMFEMYIYTMGDRPYALEMAKLLDPENKYFDGRVISRDDGTQRHEKGLDVILGQESAVLILDDTKDAWRKHEDNLILMERYLYFPSSEQYNIKYKSLSQLDCDESESQGALATVVTVLRKIHEMFFAEFVGEPSDRDTRKVLRKVRKKILRGCRIVFSRVSPAKFPQIREMAEQLGATFSACLESSVTHVVAEIAGMEKCSWAVRENKFMVHPRWIEAAYFRWGRQPEADFPCVSTNHGETVGLGSGGQDRQQDGV